MKPVLLDLNNPVFQHGWFALEREHALAVLASLRRIQKLGWQQLCTDRGLRWEAIQSRLGPGNQRIYSLRITRSVRAMAYREGDYLRFLSIHPDHDSAYE